MAKPKPSIDWGYPIPADGPFPAFNNIDEEAEFWDTHTVTESGEVVLLSAEDFDQPEGEHPQQSADSALDDRGT